MFVSMHVGVLTPTLLSCVYKMSSYCISAGQKGESFHILIDFHKYIILEFSCIKLWPTSVVYQ